MSIFNEDIVSPGSIHKKAVQVVEADPNLTEGERTALLRCLDWRNRNQNFRQRMIQQADLDRHRADSEADELRDLFNSRWHPQAILFRWKTGAMFASQRDFQVDDLRRRKIMEAAQYRSRQTVMHNAELMGHEDKLRKELEGASPHAKRVFNTISMSGRTITHFSQAEVAPAAHLPNPLAAVLR